MTDLRQAAQQALDAWDDPMGMKDLCVAMDAIRTALEQQAEPSQWRDMVVVSLVREGIDKHKARELADHFAAPPQQQAEPVGFEMAQPVAWRFKDPKDGHWLYTTHLVDLSKKYWRLKNELFDPLYTTPPQRKPLPKGEWPKHKSPYVKDEYIGYAKSDLDDYAMQVLAAHGIKEGT